MPSTVRALFHAAGLAPEGPVSFGEAARSTKAGVYVVSDTKSPDELPQDREPQISTVSLAAWRQRCPRMTLRESGRRPTVHDLRVILESWWLNDEPVLYIGQKKDQLDRRTRAFARTPIGAARPHRGGFWLKTLEQQLYLFWCETETHEAAEVTMVEAFAGSASMASKRQLPNAEFAIPWANLMWPPRGPRKPHDLKRQTC